MDKTDILIFNVEMGQSIFIYPHSHPDYGMLIDCGNTQEFEPVDFLIKQKYITNNFLKNLTLTNYDQDHFSGLPYLKNKVIISSVDFPKNLTSPEIKNLKEKPYTDALEHICQIRDTYIYPATDWKPPYIKQTFILQKEHLENPDTNNLSQVVFVEHNGSVICIPGDLEEKGWKTIIEKQPDIKNWLAKTNIFIASHHGRDNGYYIDVFKHCKPECIVISDKSMMHDTQEDMSSIYSSHVCGDGIVFNGDLVNKRKVLTTRSDGHLYIQLSPIGSRIYQSFKHE